MAPRTPPTCARWGRKRLVLLLSCALASRALDTAECLDDGQCVDAREPGECADCAACARVCSPPAAAACLTDCGFAVLDGAYDGPTLGALHTGFQRWFDDEVADGDARRHLSFSHRGGLRGRRVHVALPDGTGAWRLSPPMIDAALYNVDVVRAAKLTFDQLGVRAPLALNFATLIHSVGGVTNEQRWHIDSSDQAGLKVQVPLTDVGAGRGPVEIAPRSAWSGSCNHVANVSVHSRRGAAIVYRHSTWHRGSAASSNRTVLDLSLSHPRSIERDDYLADFTREVVDTQRAHRRRFAERCGADGIGCASVEAVEGIRGGRGVEPPPLSPAAARLAQKANVTAGGAGWGWVWAGSRYRGEAGEGSGSWVDPNGSVYSGQWLDGEPSGAGRYEYAMGHVYEGGWRHGEPHGSGRMVHPSGEVEEFDDSDEAARANRLSGGASLSEAGGQRHDADDAGLLYNLAVINGNGGRRATEVALLERAVALRPSYHEAWGNLGVAHAQMGDLPSAGRGFAEAARLAPTFENLANLARWHAATGSKAEAKEVMARASAAKAKAMEK